MKRDIIFLKHEGLANAILNTRLCEYKGNWIIQCNDNMEDMKIIQEATREYLKDTPYKNYKLAFANSNDYRKIATV